MTCPVNVGGRPPSQSKVKLQVWVRTSGSTGHSSWYGSIGAGEFRSPCTQSTPATRVPSRHTPPQHAPAPWTTHPKHDQQEQSLVPHQWVCSVCAGIACAVPRCAAPREIAALAARMDLQPHGLRCSETRSASTRRLNALSQRPFRGIRSSLRSLSAMSALHLP